VLCSLHGTGKSAQARRVSVRDKLSTNPLPTGSTATGKTIGIVTVALRCREVTRRVKKRHDGDLFDDLIGHCENLRWQIKAERLRGSKIDHQLELRYSHHWCISRPLALQNAAGVHPGLAISIANVRAIAH